MGAIKLVMGLKDGKTVQKEIAEDKISSLMGKKIGDTFSGGELGLEGYEFMVTGGSDISGTPMRKDADGTGKRSILCVEGTGVKRQRKGLKQRKTVCGNTISDTITQVNVKVLKQGRAPIAEPKPEEEKAEKKGKN